MNKDKFYLLYACGYQKNKSTMSFLIASSKEADIRNEIMRNISNGVMKYSAGKEDLQAKDLLQLNNDLKYGYIEMLY